MPCGFYFEKEQFIFLLITDGCPFAKRRSVLCVDLHHWWKILIPLFSKLEWRESRQLFLVKVSKIYIEKRVIDFNFCTLQVLIKTLFFVWLHPNHHRKQNKIHYQHDYRLLQCNWQPGVIRNKQKEKSHHRR